MCRAQNLSHVRSSLCKLARATCLCAGCVVYMSQHFPSSKCLLRPFPPLRMPFELPPNQKRIRLESQRPGLIPPVPLTSWMEPGAGGPQPLGLSFLIWLWGSRLSPWPKEVSVGTSPGVQVKPLVLASQGHLAQVLLKQVRSEPRGTRPALGEPGNGPGSRGWPRGKGLC